MDSGRYIWIKIVVSENNFPAISIILVIVSLAVRYFFVSNSAFVASFYPVLLTIAMTTRANPMAIALLLGFFASYGALLTHYGNGAGLITFASGYLPQKDFWKVGSAMVAVAFVIFFCVGMPYWYLIGIC